MIVKGSFLNFTFNYYSFKRTKILNQQHPFPSTSSMFSINRQNNDNLVVCNRNSMPQQDSQREVLFTYFYRSFLILLTGFIVSDH